MARLLVATLAIVLAALAASAARPPAAWACSCTGEPVAAGLERSDGALVGTVLDWDVDDPAGPSVSTGDPAYATVRVERAVKGTLPRELAVRTVRSTATCGLDVRVGQRVGLLLERRGREWTSGLCAQFEPGELERLPVSGRIDDAASSGAPRRDRSAAPPALALAGVAMCAGVLALAARRRRRRGPDAVA